MKKNTQLIEFWIPRSQGPIWKLFKSKLDQPSPHDIAIRKNEQTTITKRNQRDRAQKRPTDFLLNEHLLEIRPLDQATPSRTPPAMSFFRITLHRSAIGLPKSTRGVLDALGLHRCSQTVFHPVSPQFAGMILKVKELVRVEEVDRAMSQTELRELRRPDPGFYVEKAVAR
ncbi:54S ribosomal protein L33 [Colletotrichum shisoi]|uniref:Large ribosomal subunit protein uL30m n=1 Tax=Colletotrichum shisoi TaxID=2078593 RepID=A0A5Q4C6I2_9PEZI|nr:54S ribosomal protein L33 [Colletotrichum shisoi]